MLPKGIATNLIHFKTTLMQKRTPGAWLIMFLTLQKTLRSNITHQYLWSKPHLIAVQGKAADVNYHIEVKQNKGCLWVAGYKTAWQWLWSLLTHGLDHTRLHTHLWNELSNVIQRFLEPNTSHEYFLYVTLQMLAKLYIYIQVPECGT